MRPGGWPRMPFSPISALFDKNNARNIDYMAVLIFTKCLDLRKNFYSRTTSYEIACFSLPSTETCCTFSASQRDTHIILTILKQGFIQWQKLKAHWKWF